MGRTSGLNAFPQLFLEGPISYLSSFDIGEAPSAAEQVEDERCLLVCLLFRVVVSGVLVVGVGVQLS